MTFLEPHLHACVSGGGAPGTSPPFSVELPDHYPAPTCPVFRPPPES